MTSEQLKHIDVTKELSILVSTCDRYSDAWAPFLDLFRRFWPDCKYRVYMMTNGAEIPDPRVHPIHLDAALDWSTSLRSALSVIPSSYVLLLLEDYFIGRPVKSPCVDKMLDCQIRMGWDCLRIFPVPPGDGEDAELEGFRYVRNDSKYSACTQASIWKRDILSSLLVDGENGWQFEDNASGRLARTSARVVSVVEARDWDYPISYFCTAIVQAKWHPGAIRMCRRLGVAVDTSLRPMRGVVDDMRGVPLVGKIERGLRRMARALTKKLTSRA